MPLTDIVLVCMNCIAYAYDQLMLSEIDVLGMYSDNPAWKKEEQFLLASVYAQLDALTPELTYRHITRRELQEVLEVKNDNNIWD